MLTAAAAAAYAKQSVCVCAQNSTVRILALLLLAPETKLMSRAIDREH